MRRAVQDYRMIADGDRIFVGLSGGKDSVLLTAALAAYRRFSPEKFSLEAISVDMGFKRADNSADKSLSAWCESIGVPRHIVKTDIAEIIFEARKESNPCSLCAKLRRGALNSEINRLGGGTLALGHNADDVAETVLLSLLYEGRFSCFAPTAYMDKSGVKLIRPLIYIEECDIARGAHRLPAGQNNQTGIRKTTHKKTDRGQSSGKTKHSRRGIPPGTRRLVAKARITTARKTRDSNVFILSLSGSSYRPTPLRATFGTTKTPHKAAFL